MPNADATQCLVFLLKNHVRFALATVSALQVTPSIFDSENKWRWLKKIVIVQMLLRAFPEFTRSTNDGYDFDWNGIRILLRTYKKVFSHAMADGEMSIPKSISLKNRQIDEINDHSDRFFNADILIVIQESPFAIGTINIAEIPQECILPDRDDYFAELRNNDYFDLKQYNNILTTGYKEDGDEIFITGFNQIVNKLCDKAESLIDK